MDPQEEIDSRVTPEIAQLAQNGGISRVRRSQD
jgi:hypothetical protein